MNKQKTFAETPSHTDTSIITASDAALRFIAAMHGAEVPLDPFSAAVTAQALASALHPYKTPHGREADSKMVMAISTTQQQSATADPLHTAHPSPEQLYTMVTARFKAGTFPWSMVSESGKSAWAAAAAELVFAPDTIMASHAPQPAQQQAEPVAAQCRFEGEEEWSPCTLAHHLLVQAHPKEWPHYETRALYAQPPAVAVADTGCTCKECGSTNLTWHTSNVIRSNVQQGRLNTNDVECLFYLGCDDCSETLITLRADKVAGMLGKIAAAQKGGA